MCGPKTLTYINSLTSIKLLQRGKHTKIPLIIFSSVYQFTTTVNHLMSVIVAKDINIMVVECRDFCRPGFARRNVTRRLILTRLRLKMINDISH